MAMFLRRLQGRPRRILGPDPWRPAAALRGLRIPCRVREAEEMGGPFCHKLLVIGEEGPVSHRQMVGNHEFTHRPF